MPTTETSGRVAKGVFVSRGKLKTVDTATQDADHGCDPVRARLCDEILERVDEKLNLMTAQLNEKLFADLLEYVERQVTDFSPRSADGRQSHGLPEIPTAALITGVNTSDHAAMFSNLVALLREKVTSYIAVLKSKDCATLRAMIKTCLTEVMDGAEILDEDDDADVPCSSGAQISGTFITLENWYREVNGTSPRKSPRKGKRPPRHTPVVFVLEDLESFTPSVLQDFITICGHHAHELPLVLVFGIATTVTAVHKILPQHVSSFLCMEKFQASASSESLSQVIEKVVMAPEMSFKLGGRVFNILMDLFLYHDFSVLRFVQGYQAALLNHFYTNRASVLCVAPEDLGDVVSSQDSDSLDAIRSTNSFRTYVESQKPKEQIKLLEDDAHTVKTIVKFLENLSDYNRCVVAVLSCLHCFVRKLPGYPLGQRKREVYSVLLSQSLCESDQYRESMNLLRALSRNEMMDKLAECCDLLADESLDDIRDKLVKLRDKFDNLDLMSACPGSEDDSSEEIPEKPVDSLPQNFHDLKEQLLQKNKNKKKLTGYEITRNETVDFLDSVFKKYLVNPTIFPLHEAVYYNDVSFIKRHLIGKPRSILERALSSPQYYLSSENVDITTATSAILPTLPDVCIAYRLHQECGRLINLYDWLQAFVTVVQADSDDTEGQSQPDQLLQARFIRAVSELEFLGFIKPTRRKTDHVARLTWGGC